MTEWRCPECGTANDGSVPRCMVCDGPAPESVAHRPAPLIDIGPRVPAPAPAPTGQWRVIGVGLVILLSLVGAGYLLVDAGPESAADTVIPAETLVVPPEIQTEVHTEVPSEVPTEPPPLTGVGLVSIGEGAVADPRAGEVAALFHTYFAGINAHTPSIAAEVFAPGGVVEPGDPVQVARFDADTATTTDTNAWLLDIEGDAHSGDVTATVSFTSTQNAGYGPAGRTAETCTDWYLHFQLTMSPTGGYRIMGTAPGSTSAPCAT